MSCVDWRLRNTAITERPIRLALSAEDLLWTVESMSSSPLMIVVCVLFNLSMLNEPWVEEAEPSLSELKAKVSIGDRGRYKIGPQMGNKENIHHI